jgi:cell division transport system permease protein
MPWVLAIMMFLTVLAAAAGLGLGNAARNLDSQVGNRLVVQIVEANPDMRSGRRGGRSRNWAAGWG